MILNIETSTTVCSVALSDNGELVSIKEINNGYTHAENLTVFIDELMQQSKLSYKDLKAVAVSKGPGSYTGLRIGVSAAKGLCYALDIPLIAINTLESMAQNFLMHEQINEKSLLCPMIDARRMEVYCALYDNNLTEIQTTQALVIDKHSFSEKLLSTTIIFFGDGAQKCKSVLSHNGNAIINSAIYASAKGMIKGAFLRYKAQKFENLAYFEPFYLKNFIPGIGSTLE